MDTSDPRLYQGRPHMDELGAVFVEKQFEDDFDEFIKTAKNLDDIINYLIECVYSKNTIYDFKVSIAEDQESLDYILKLVVMDFMKEKHLLITKISREMMKDSAHYNVMQLQQSINKKLEIVANKYITDTI